MTVDVFESNADLRVEGDTIEDFLNNIFNPQFQLKEIYTNKN